MYSESPERQGNIPSRLPAFKCESGACSMLVSLIFLHKTHATQSNVIRDLMIKSNLITLSRAKQELEATKVITAMKTVTGLKTQPKHDYKMKFHYGQSKVGKLVSTFTTALISCTSLNK